MLVANCLTISIAFFFATLSVRWLRRNKISGHNIVHHFLWSSGGPFSVHLVHCSSICFHSSLFFGSFLHSLTMAVNSVFHNQGAGSWTKTACYRTQGTRGTRTWAPCPLWSGCHTLGNVLKINPTTNNRSSTFTRSHNGSARATSHHETSRYVQD